MSKDFDIALVMARWIPVTGSVLSSPEMTGRDILSGIGDGGAVGVIRLLGLGMDGEGGGALSSSMVSNATINDSNAKSISMALGRSLD